MMPYEVGDYVCENKIGTGSFAEVWKGYHKLTKQPVAVKIVDLERLSRSNNNHENKLKQHLNSELRIMKALDHKNIVKMFDFTETKVQITMILELCEGGDFSKYIKTHKRLSEKRAKYFMQQLASGLGVLRKEGVIHRDLKPQNLLLSDTSDRPLLKIADFGFARYIDTQSLAHTLCGSPLYMAPEILTSKNYTIKADLWSVGIILYEILMGTPPFEAKNIISLIQAVEENNIKFPPNIQISPVCMDLIKGLLQKDPTQRISWEEFFLHPWLSMHQSQPQPSIPQSHPHTHHSHAPTTLHHSKSQSSIPSPIRNFLHDEQLLNKNLFTQIANLPLNLNQNNAIPPPIPLTNQPQHLPRSNSTSVLPSYKMDNLGNVIPVNPGATAAQLTNPLLRNNQDAKKINRTTPTGLSNMTGPSSLPTSIQYSRHGSGSGSGSSGSSSPPKGLSPFSTPPISPNPAATPKGHPIPTSAIPSVPLSTSPPNLPKAVSAVDHLAKEHYRRASEPTAVKHPLSFSQKQFVVPKMATSNSDSFEKDCVILDNSTGNTPSTELSLEDKVISAIDAKYRRSLAVSDLGDLKIEAETPYEAFAVYIKGVAMFWDTLTYARARALEHNLSQSTRLLDIVNNIKEKASLYIRTVTYWRSVLRQDESIANPDPIIYYHALHMGRLAAVEEYFKDYAKSEEVYYTAMLLLESLFRDDIDPYDKEILEKYIAAFGKRLATVQSKKTSKV